MDKALLQKVADFAAREVDAGCGYIMGATGWVCNPKMREAQAKQYPESAKSILTTGAKWDGKRCYDCAQLTRWSVGAAGGSLLSGATNQWKKTDWEDKGTINTLPEIPGVLLYRCDNAATMTMGHTGVYLGGGRVAEAQSTQNGCVYSRLPARWTHWTIYKFVEVVQVTYPYQATVKTKTGGGVGIWDKPNNSSKKLYTAPDGATVFVTAPPASGTFASVIYGGKVGYADTQYLIPVPVTAPPTAPEVPGVSTGDMISVPASEIADARDKLRALDAMLAGWKGRQ
ncbi:hypothetical protein FACS1894196_3650 [Clostridia bacterium]|nr:hypothetical protein FACS1894196_3650 [Clostridia bacterium]